jgi:Domain of unknown function (DUF1707)/Domain of unknown function (DUF4190)
MSFLRARGINDSSMEFEPPIPGLRASDADREATVSRLHKAATEGRLDADELEERLTAAYAAKFCTDLAQLTADVTPPARHPAHPSGAPVFVSRPRRTNGLAVASFVASLLWMWWFGSVVAVVFGHLALRQINASGGRQTGRGLAISGLVLGYAGILVAALLLVAGAFT